MQSLKGQFLLDGGKLTGSPFERTVVLICQHDPSGAFGLVLNRPSGHKVGEALAEDLPESVRETPLFVGGPVQPRTLTCLLHDSTDDIFSHTQILPGLRIVQDLAELAEPSQVKFFAGYAGWGPGQLDNEMRRRDWLTHPASVTWVFHPTPAELWPLILRSKGSDFRLLADSPDDPSLN